VNINKDVMTTIVTFVVTGGLAAMITQLARSWGVLRSGSRANTRELVKDLAAARDEAEERLAVQTADVDYWRGVAGDYSYQLRQAGLMPMPAEPMAPSARFRQGVTKEQRRRADRAPSTGEIKRIEGGGA
jgi:hypothetical protein